MNSAANWAASLARIRQREWLDPILDQLPVGFIIVEAPSGRVLEGNRPLERIFRHPIRYSAGVADFGEWVGYHPDGRPYAPRDWPIARALTGIVTTGEEIEIGRGDGTRGFVSIDAAPICDENDVIVAALAIVQDITEKKKSEKRLKDILESTTDCVLVLDRGWRFSFLNRRAIQEIAGERDLTGLNIWEEFPFAAGTPFWDNYHRAMDQREEVTFQAFYPEPLQRWYQVHAYPSDEGIAVFFRNVTAEKEMRDALQRSEAQAREKATLLEMTLEHMDQGLMMVGADQRVLLHNRRALDLLDLPSGLLAKKPFFEEIRQHQLRSGEYSHAAGEVLDVALKPEFNMGPPVYERERPNGTVLEVRTMPLPGGGAVRTYTDVTARKRAEVEVRDSEERYRALVTATASMVWRASPDGAIIDGVGWQDFTGQFPAASRQHGWLDAIHPEDRERVVARWKEVLASGEPGDNPYRVRRADGEYRWMVSRGAPVKNPDGTIREWVGTITDIHEHKVAQEEQARSEARYRLLAENATDVIFRTGLDGKRLYLSPSAREIYGYDPDDLLGTDATHLIHPEDGPRMKADLEATIAGKPGHDTSVYRIRHKAGHWVWLEARRRLVRDDGGTPIEVVGIVRDISERKRLEEQLRQAQKMEAVGQLTGGIAHDFNNLLTVVIGNAEVLAEEVADPDHKALARMALEAAERGANLTQHLLAFGRRQTLKPERLNLTQVVQGLEPLLRRTVGEHIELVTDFAPGAPVALTDRTLLESALLNLVVNARDAMSRGGTLTLRTGVRPAREGEGQLPAGQPLAFVTVSDTGTGIPPEDLPRVFDPFFTTKEVGRGSGLGLSMVYGFAEQTGGHACIESEVGRGTSVTILLRAVRAGPDQTASAADEGLSGGPERVLVVEDEAQVRQFVCTQLASFGYDVTAVEAAPEALDLLRRDPAFDLLFSDVVLPKGMSGVELAKRARAVRPDLKVLLTSGYPEEAFEHHGRPEEGTILLRKPYRRKDLAETLRKVLESAASPGGPRPTP